MGDNQNVSRRDFLKTTGIATGTLVGGGLIGGLIGYNMKGSGDTKPVVEQETTKQNDNHNHTETNTGAPIRGRMFFTNQRDFHVLSEATERIFPEDDLGPGAIKLGVPYFIDYQLAGAYGNNAKEYMQGPFYEGAPTQGYQSRLTRAEIFKQGVHKIEEEAQKRFSMTFVKLEPEQMDEILTAFQKGEVEMAGIASSYFFTLLRSATLEGVYSDPMYGGNYDMAGWKMKNFPGHQMAYTQYIEQEEFIVIEPKSLGS
ncbi:gluconate 2-dehydrogenase subunit 3 family protein [Lysinibacillus sp. LZ02]|uniref:gluconate 2-dehydrogenase subunit 3 family protein n=1 Tax=Lysinibacillus sp. LZ02 TaxID=3420668 RepID=UPI003D365D94